MKVLNVDEVKYGRGGENRDQNSAISSYIVYIDFKLHRYFKLRRYFKLHRFKLHRFYAT